MARQLDPDREPAVRGHSGRSRRRRAHRSRHQRLDGLRDLGVPRPRGRNLRTAPELLDRRRPARPGRRRLQSRRAARPRCRRHPRRRRVCRGDEGPATSASFRLPSSLALDPRGHLLVADFDNNRIRKIDSAGIVTTVAGTGAAAYSGDGGPATAAALYRPFSLAVAADGTIFFADLQNNRIRKIDPSGTIDTVAGTGSFGTAGDGGPASDAQIGPVVTIAVDRQGTIDIADRLNGRIRAIDEGTIRTVASDVGRPTAIAVDGSGGVYFTTAERIARLMPPGSVETVVDLTAAVQLRALHGVPSSLAVAPDGTVYIADPTGNAVSRIDRSGSVTQISGPTPAAAPATAGRG